MILPDSKIILSLSLCLSRSLQIFLRKLCSTAGGVMDVWLATQIHKSTLNKSGSNLLVVLEANLIRAYSSELYLVSPHGTVQPAKGPWRRRKDIGGAGGLHPQFGEGLRL